MEQSSQRPRLWVPGLVFVTPQGDVRLGPSAGYSSRDAAFRRLRCGYRGSLTDWTHVAWLVARNALTAGVVAEHGILLPEALIDRDALPHAHRWLREQPLVCVSGSSWEQLTTAGMRVHRVAFDGTGDRVLHIERTGGTTGLTSLTVSLRALEAATTVAGEGLDLVDWQGDPTPIDRALRAVSAGVLDECSVLNAFAARSLIEDGYGYHGALEGRFGAMKSVTHELEPLDALFAQIFERAARMRPVAEHLLADLAHAGPEARDVSVPLYGEAHALIVPALRVQVDRLVIDGVTVAALELASEQRWSVDGVDAWSPHG